MTEDFKLTYTETDVDLMQSLRKPGKGYWVLLTFLFLLICAGGYAWGVQIANGIGEAGKNNPVGWAMYIATFVFWVGIAHSGTLISAILFLFRVKWRAAVYRSAEAVTIFGLATAGLFPFIHLGRVWVAHWILPIPNFGGLWPNFRSPLAWDVLAITTYLTASTLFFTLGMMPDVAIVRDKTSGWRKKCTAFSLWAGRGATTNGGITLRHTSFSLPFLRRWSSRSTASCRGTLP